MTSASIPDRGRITSAQAAVLAASLLSLELLAGVQSYLLNTVLPVVGAELNARDYYGVIVGSVEVAMFLTMPLGPWLLSTPTGRHIVTTETPTGHRYASRAPALPTPMRAAT